MASPTLNTLKVASGNYARENDLVRELARGKVLNAYDAARMYEQYLDPTYGSIARTIGAARNNSANRGFGSSGRIAQLAADQPLRDVTLQARDATFNLGQQGLSNAYGYNNGMANSATDSMAWGQQNKYYGHPDQGIYSQARNQARSQIGR